MKTIRCVAFFLSVIFVLLSRSVSAQEDPASLWQYGGTIDLNYANDFQSTEEVTWRSKSTTIFLNQFSPNMGMIYLRKQVSADSPWGLELGAQAGYDTNLLAPSTQRLSGADFLRYIARANVSYLVPLGKGLTLTAGLMNSFIGYESVFAKDNQNYTRSWIADNSPYYLIGIGGQYPVTEQLNVGLYLLSDYNYLGYVNDNPKYGSQISWSINPQWKLSQNFFIGPEQQNTAVEFWRYFSDTILQWSNQDLTSALAYDVGTERLNVPGPNDQTLWMGSAWYSRWHIDGSWSVALRPEIYWDRDGRLTGSKQLIKAITATAEYKINFDNSSVAFRTEYRIDDSTGKQGGFIQANNSNIGLIGTQQLVFFSCLLTLDK